MADEFSIADSHSSPSMAIRQSRRVGWGMALLGLLSAIVLLWWNWHATPQSELEVARRLIGQPEQALKLVRASVQAAHGDYPEAQLFECQLLLDLNRGSEAERSFNQIHRLEACEPANLYEVAVHATTANRLSLARKALVAAGNFVHLDAKRVKLLIYVLYSLRDRSAENQVLELCNEHANLAPADPFPWLISSSLHRELSNSHLAFDAYREALKRSLPPEEAERVRIQIVELSLVLGDLATARETYDTLVQKSQANVLSGQLMDLQTQLMYREGKLDELVTLLDDVLNRQPQLTAARALRGKCRAELGDHAGAITDLETVVRENDYDQRSHYLLGHEYLNLKDGNRGQVHLNRSRELIEIGSQIMTLENQLRNDPNNRGLMLRLVELNERRGDHEKAISWRSEARNSEARSPQ